MSGARAAPLPPTACSWLGVGWALPRQTHGEFLRELNGVTHGPCHQERVCTFLVDPLFTPWLSPGRDSLGGEGAESEPVQELMHK